MKFVRLDRLLVLSTLLLGTFTATVGLSQTKSEPTCTPARCAYLNPSLPAEKRAEDLVSRMTLEEKVAQTVDGAPGIERLQVNPYNWWNEGLHGVARSGVATVFPQAIGLAATWNVDLMHAVAGTISTEARARYNEAQRVGRFSRYTGLTYWSPNINIFRDPRWGRGQETYGEDPYLTGRMGVAFIRGLQGDDPRYLKVVATPKHYAVHSGPESTRHHANVNPSAFDLYDTYLPAFHAAITEAKADSIMCAYNAVDGKPACASDALLQRILRQQWGFQGFVVSDCDSVGDVYQGHHYAKDDVSASAVSLKAGTDLDCGATYHALLPAVKSGAVQEKLLDQTLIRLFTARIRLGMFDPAAGNPYSQLSAKDIHTPTHQQQALDAARESIVLLKNQKGTLPLAVGRRIAVVGPTAQLLQAVEGNYMGTSENPVLPLDGIRQRYGAERVSYSPGATLVDGSLDVISSRYLSTDKEGRQRGLKAEYFANVSLLEKPVEVRTEAIINYNWDSATPSDKVQLKRYSARWSGYLQLPASGDYSFEIHGLPRPKKTVDGTGENSPTAAGAQHIARLLIDGRVVVDATDSKSATAKVNVSAGAHAVLVEYTGAGSARNFSLRWTPPAGALLSDAEKDAAQADVVVAVVGLSPDLEGEEMGVKLPGFTGGDRSSIDLPETQLSLLKAMKATGKPLVVVLTSGSAVAMNWAASDADALLALWYGGEKAGTALADVIAGEVSPSGKLPITFYRSLKGLPEFDDYGMKNRTYRYFKGEVLYPFGYGLSYAAWKLSSAQLDHESINAGDSFRVTAELSNESAIAADQVVEVYIQPEGEHNDANPYLAGFAKVHLDAHQTKKFELQIEGRELSRVDKRGVRSVHAGQYRVFIGDGQPVHSSWQRSLTLQVKGQVEISD